MSIAKPSPSSWLAVLLIAVAAVAGCRKPVADPAPVVPTDSTPVAKADTNSAFFTVSIFHGQGTDTLLLNQPITTASGTKLTLSQIRYYLSNPVLIDSAGNRVPLGDWYHIVSLANPLSLRFTLPGAKAGRYRALELMIGVDSLRNCQGAQTGALASDSNMFWGWGSSRGYIHSMVEGMAGRSSAFSWHLTGFAAPNANQRRIRLPLAGAAILPVQPKMAVTLFVQADLLRLFDGSVDPTQVQLLGLQSDAAALADLWATSFSVDTVTVGP